LLPLLELSIQSEAGKPGLDRGPEIARVSGIRVDESAARNHREDQGAGRDTAGGGGGDSWPQVPRILPHPHSPAATRRRVNTSAPCIAATQAIERSVRGKAFHSVAAVLQRKHARAGLFRRIKVIGSLRERARPPAVPTDYIL